MGCRTCGSKVKTSTPRTTTTAPKPKATSEGNTVQTFYYAGKIYEVKR